LLLPRSGIVQHDVIAPLKQSSRNRLKRSAVSTSDLPLGCGGVMPIKHDTSVVEEFFQSFSTGSVSNIERDLTVLDKHGQRPSRGCAIDAQW
jgi:hypothetical protein